MNGFILQPYAMTDAGDSLFCNVEIQQLSSGTGKTPLQPSWWSTTAAWLCQAVPHQVQSSLPLPQQLVQDWDLGRRVIWQRVLQSCRNYLSNPLDDFYHCCCILHNLLECILEKSHISQIIALPDVTVQAKPLHRSQICTWAFP